ncbi:MAG: transposase [Elainellaceae cyanobacterium]
MSPRGLGNIGVVDVPVGPMKYNPDKHHRRSMRLKGYDYSSPGFYFITICTHQRLCLFGNVEGNKMHLNEFGQVVLDCWQAIPQHFCHIELDEFVIMPNHIHGIIIVNNGRDMAPPCPTKTQNRQFSRPVPGAISTAIGSFKSIATKRINEIRNAPGCPVWQSQFYDRIIRDRDALDRIQRYIQQNPLAWQTDKLYSDAVEGDGG